MPHTSPFGSPGARRVQKGPPLWILRKVRPGGGAVGDFVRCKHTQMQPMVLKYLPTSLGDFWGFYVGKYSSTMEHMG